MAQPILIDTDCGVDDAVALAFALCAPDLCDVRAITCVDGNAPLNGLASTFSSTFFSVFLSFAFFVNRCCKQCCTCNETLWSYRCPLLSWM